MIKKRLSASILTIFVFSVLIGNSLANVSQDGIWRKIDDTALAIRPLTRTPTPAEYSTFELDKLRLRGLLKSAPEEFTQGSNDAIIELPMPDGKLGRFRFEHSLVVEPGLLAKYPELGETFRGYGVDDPAATVRFDILPSGFHAMVLSPNGTVLIDPYAIGDTDNYVTYFKRDLPKLSDFKCGVGEKNMDSLLNDSILHPEYVIPDVVPDVTSGSQLRTYRLALAADNEYAAAVGGNTVAGTLAAQVLIMNRVNGVYERDVAIHMNIVANNNLIVYAGDNTSCGGVACTSANDPYTNTSPSTLLNQNVSNLSSVIGNANFDIGHVFTTGGGGLASLGVPCGGSKASAETGLSNPVGDAYAIDYVAHEMGHQWGANHTFNGAVSNCGGGNRASSAAYETGSGITIMAYAGICGNQDLALHSIDTFHVKSLQEIVAYSQAGNGNTCAVTTATGNTPPTVSVAGGSSFNIPKQTPFSLTANGSDVNNDVITYDWQEYDLGASTTAVPNTDSGGAMPVLRPYLPTASPSRTFPSLTYILNNANIPPSTFDCGRGAGTPCLTGELLPQIGRTMTFQVVARDNRANAGGINSATATVVVDANSGPFAVTSPNTGVAYTGGSTQTVTWNVANTTNAPVNAADVKISFSSDGGNTFPTVLAASTPNDGTQAVTIPNVATTTARIKVESATGIFFDISDANFTVNASGVKSRADFDGDGKTDVSVFRPSDGNWYLNRSTAGFSVVHWGVSGDTLLPGDYDGDGKADFAIFRPSDISGNTDFFILNSNGFTLSGYSHGSTGDIAVPGDFDGDGKNDIVVWRPSTGTWWEWLTTTQTTTGVQFGSAGDLPFVMDNDGDGKANLAVYRPSVNTFFIAKPTGVPSQNFDAIVWGQAGDIVVPGDYDGDNKEDVAVFRPSNGVWYIRQSTNGALNAIQFGANGDVPVPGDYDGDGKDDAAVFRNGIWYLNQSTAGFAAVSFGVGSDKAIPAAYHP